jgi:co-chaperonin GroES (HSP10)
MKIRPKQGEALLAMEPPEAVSPGGIAIPELDQELSQCGRVVRFGRWRQAKKSGALIPHPCQRGDLVYISQRAGRWLDAEGKRWKLIDTRQILAVLSDIAPSATRGAD